MGGVAILMREVNGQPAIDQHIVNSWPITWNPDDEKFHVARKDGTSVAVFKELRNARQYAKGHKAN